MAVGPGIYNLTLNRGTVFDSFILKLTDQNVSVSVDAGSAVTYVASGKFSGYDLFILTGNPSAFLYFNPVATSYVIASILKTGALTDYFLPSAPLTEPTGTYIGAGTFNGHTAVATNHPVDLTGYTPELQVRRQPLGGLVLTLDATVTDDVGGEITVAAITADDTRAITSHGNFNWDLVLATLVNRFGPYVKGSFTISDNITQATSAPPTPP